MIGICYFWIFWCKIHFLLDKEKICVILTANMLCDQFIMHNMYGLHDHASCWFEVGEVRRISKITEAFDPKRKGAN
jgi:hypothetical protein